MTSRLTSADSGSTTGAASTPADETGAPLLAPEHDEPVAALDAPVNLRSASLVVIATLALLVVLHWA
ncbi:MAG TPA: hypothetical protein VIY30_12280, partial [Burkholderiaceae bacterium]